MDPHRLSLCERVLQLIILCLATVYQKKKKKGWTIGLRAVCTRFKVNARSNADSDKVAKQISK